MHELPGVQPIPVPLQLFLVSGFGVHSDMSHGSVTPTRSPAMYAKNTGCSLSFCGRALAATLHPNRVPADGGATGKGEEGQADPP